MTLKPGCRDHTDPIRPLHGAHFDVIRRHVEDALGTMIERVARSEAATVGWYEWAGRRFQIVIAPETTRLEVFHPRAEDPPGARDSRREDAAGERRGEAQRTGTAIAPPSLSEGAQ